MEQKTYGLGSQQDGDHYLKMRLQPVDLAYRLGATPCFTKLAKYLTRDKGDKLTNLQKARHCVTLEMDLKKYASIFYDNERTALISAEMLTDLLVEFSEDKLIRNALYHLWHMRYLESLEVVDQIISRYQESL